MDLNGLKVEQAEAAPVAHDEAPTETQDAPTSKAEKLLDQSTSYAVNGQCKMADLLHKKACTPGADSAGVTDCTTRRAVINHFCP